LAARLVQLHTLHNRQSVAAVHNTGRWTWTPAGRLPSKKIFDILWLCFDFCHVLCVVDIFMSISLLIGLHRRPMTARFYQFELKWQKKNVQTLSFLRKVVKA
jgi:hypothetical protein